MYKPSFIDKSSLTKLSTGEFIMKMFYLEKRRIKELKNLDLSEVDFSGKNIYIKRNFDRWEINNVIFSRFNSESSEKKYLYGLSFKGAKMDRVSFVQAFLDRCNFDWEEKQNDKSEEKKDNVNPNLEKVDFFFSELGYCRFRGCKMKMVDFRYAKVSDCSMNDTNVTYGDFYDCNFKGCTTFVESNFKDCSFTNAVFEHQVIRFNKIHGILQDDIKDYCKIIFGQKWLHYNPCGTRKSDLEKKELRLLEKEIREEAIEMYRHLSGIYAGKGLIKDSNKAYRKMKEKELQESWENAKNTISGLLFFLVLLGFLFCTLFEYGYICKVVFSCTGAFILYLFYNCIKDCIKKPLQYIWQKTEYFREVVSGFFTYSMGYGYKWGNVIIVYVLLIFFGAAYKNVDNCSLNSWKNALYFSFNNIIGLGNCYGMLAGVHHLLGVLLIGYLGFIFANKMRNSL